MRHHLGLALALLFAATTACTAGGGSVASGPIHITAPEDGAFLASGSVTVTGTTELSVTEISVQGTTVPVEGGAFETTLSLPDGSQVIVASAGAESTSIAVTIDSTPPIVVVDEPRPASYVEGDTVRVRGHVQDATFQRLLIDGEDFVVGEDGHFDVRTTVTPGAHRFRVAAEDQAGHVGYQYVSFLAGDYGAPTRAESEAVAMHLGPDSMRELAEAVVPHLGSDQLRSLITSANPGADAWWGTMSVLGEDHTMPEVAFTPREGYLELAVVLSDVAVPFEVDLAVGPTIRGTAYVDRASAVAEVRTRVESGFPVVELGDVEVVLSGLFIDVTGLWDWIDRNIVTSALSGTITEKIRGLIATQIPPVVDGMLSQLPLSRNVDMLGSTTRIHGGFDRIDVTRRGLSVVLDVGLDVLHPDSSTIAGSPGTLLMGDAGAPPLEQDALGAAVSLDVLNHALYAAWSTGQLEYRADSPVTSTGEGLTFGAILLLAPGLRGRADPEDPVSFVTKAALPIVVQPSTTGGLVELVAPDLRTEAYAHTADGDQLLFTVSIGFRATVDLSLTAAEIGARISDYEIQVDPIGDVPPGTPLGPALDDLFGVVFEPVITPLLDVGSFPVPTLGGFSFDGPRAFLDDNYLVFEGVILYTGE